MDNNKKILYIPDGTKQVTYKMLDDYREALEEVLFIFKRMFSQFVKTFFC